LATSPTLKLSLLSLLLPRYCVRGLCSPRRPLLLDLKTEQSQCPLPARYPTWNGIRSSQKRHALLTRMLRLQTREQARWNRARLQSSARRCRRTLGRMGSWQRRRELNQPENTSPIKAATEWMLPYVPSCVLGKLIRHVPCCPETEFRLLLAQKFQLLAGTTFWDEG
jgi:hypothetical protein